MEKITKNKIIKYIISILVCTGLAIYLSYHIFYSSSQNIVAEIAYPITDEVTIRADGYIMRNEKVLTGPADGASVAYYHDDGTKVSLNEPVVAVYSGENTDHGNVLINIDKNIDFLRESNVDTIYKTSDTASVDARINELFYSIRSDLEGGNVNGVISNSRTMLMFLNRRMVITGESAGYDSKIEALEAEKESYSAALGSQSNTVTADVSGYFYSSCDGYEGIFTSDVLSSMSYDNFISFTEMSPEDTSGAVGKIAYDYSWRLACPVAKGDLKDFSLNSTYDIIFEANAGTSVSMRLIKIIPDTDTDGALLVFECDNNPEDFTFARMQPVRIVKSSVSGIRIPKGAMRVVDGQSGVYILYGSKVRFSEFDILAESDNYYIASTPDGSDTKFRQLKLYDNIIVSGKDIFEGKVIN